ncbi:hypothetical protein H0H81_008598 [Sphagnurus paluster]|uniref:Uncharacterized protein n=1 Tax=Sphagnurus paluster TaxID=117069 RepID=A0A9P7GR23_9AGAR|nr:hypothetical protein H0H81_008598 [Sphagnurus paluster]
MQKTLDTIRFDGTDTRLTNIPSASEISEFFDVSLLSTFLFRYLRVLPAASDAWASQCLFSSPNRGFSLRSPADEGTAKRLQSKRHKGDVPSLGGLPGFLGRPLPDSAKIPITEHMYACLVSDDCAEDAVGTVFKIGEEFDPDLESRPFLRRCYERSACRRRLFKLQVSLRSGSPMSVASSSSWYRTGDQHLDPDYRLGSFSFRGEERHGGSGDAKAGLVDKLDGVYDPAPYMYMLGE